MNASWRDTSRTSTGKVSRHDTNSPVPHPGEILHEEFLAPLGMSGRQLAEAICVPSNRITDIVRERRGITADTAIHLGKFFGTDARFWMNLQIAHDLSKAEAEGDYSDIRKRA